MAKREVIEIVNIQKSTDKNEFSSTIFRHIWESREGKYRREGWLPKEEIAEVKHEVVEDDKGIETIEIVELDDTVDDYDLMSLDELKALCKEKEIKFHHASKESKLISLLRGE